jgi:hypothetical protein
LIKKKIILQKMSKRRKLNDQVNFNPNELSELIKEKSILVKKLEQVQDRISQITSACTSVHADKDAIANEFDNDEKYKWEKPKLGVYLKILQEHLFEIECHDNGLNDFGGRNIIFNYDWQESSGLTIPVRAECYPSGENPHVSSHGTAIYSISWDEMKESPPAWALPGIYLIKIQQRNAPINIDIFLEYYESLKTTKYTVDDAKHAIEKLKRFVPQWFAKEKQDVFLL